MQCNILQSKKKKEIMSFVIAWMNLEITDYHTKRSKSEKDNII